MIWDEFATKTHTTRNDFRLPNCLLSIVFICSQPHNKLPLQDIPNRNEDWAHFKWWLESRKYSCYNGEAFSSPFIRCVFMYKCKCSSLSTCYVYFACVPYHSFWPLILHFCISVFRFYICKFACTTDLYLVNILFCHWLTVEENEPTIY